MKKTLTASLIVAIMGASTATADPARNDLMEPETITKQVAAAPVGEYLVPLLLLAVVVAVASSSGGSAPPVVAD